MELVFEGLKLTIIGMTIVYIFLVLLMVLIMISAKIFKQKVEFQKISIEQGKSINPPIPVISAAIAAYRARKKR
jgi:Na+-transporting methylmalonyl-CoA/oxaloacetate decarboxylase gamma subunit